jgi:D-sedoheptulose 7-phosphate isomerase
MEAISAYITDLQKTLERLPLGRIEQVIELLQAARVEKRQVFIMGNGGSASTASHFVCDLGKNTRVAGWADYRVIGLTDNMAIFSAYANDEGYEQVFSRQLASLVQPDDVVIGISTSGNSVNVLNAIVLANQRGAKTIGFTGFDGGELRSLVDLEVHVDSDCIEQVEDIHLVLEHMITKALRELVSAEHDLEQSIPATLPGAVLAELQNDGDLSREKTGENEVGSLAEVEISERF